MPSVGVAEISFEQSSVVDPVGRVFNYQNRVYRAINSEYADQVLESLRLATRHGWFEAGLVETCVSDLKIDGYDFVLEHKRIPFVTLPGEWSAAGLQKAALSHLKLCMTMMRTGHCLKDSHAYNMLFDGTRPIFIDFGSISPFLGYSDGYWLAEFYRAYLAPLILFADGKTGLARNLMQELAHGAGTWLLRNCAERLVDLPQFDSLNITTLERLYDQIVSMKFPSDGGSWNEYMTLSDDWREKDHQFAKQLDCIDFASVTDIGANRGIHAAICAKRGAEVLACDIEEACLNSLFDASAEQNLSLTPIFLDIVRPLEREVPLLHILRQQNASDQTWS